MIESREGVRNADAIAAIKGVDVLLIGSFDLTSDMGLAGQFRHPDVEASIQAVADACKKHGKVLGVGGTQRSPVAPDIPTVAEQGLPGFQSQIWFALAAPPDTPAAIAKKIQTDVKTILDMPEIAAKLRSQSLEPQGTTPERTRQWFDEDRELWGKIIKDAGITLD